MAKVHKGRSCRRPHINLQVSSGDAREVLEKVISDKGSAGMDGMKAEDLRDYMNANQTSIRQSTAGFSLKARLQIADILLTAEFTRNLTYKIVT